MYIYSSLEPRFISLCFYSPFCCFQPAISFADILPEFNTHTNPRPKKFTHQRLCQRVGIDTCQMTTPIVKFLMPLGFCFCFLFFVFFGENEATII